MKDSDLKVRYRRLRMAIVVGGLVASAVAYAVTADLGLTLSVLAAGGVAYVGSWSAYQKVLDPATKTKTNTVRILVVLAIAVTLFAWGMLS